MKRSPTKRLVFAQKTIQQIAPPKSGRVSYYDSHMPDLGLRVDANGRKAFFWFRQVNGRPTFKTIGTFPATNVVQARGKAHELSADLERLKRNDYEGKNPFESTREEPTLGELLEDYIVRHLRLHAKKPQDAEQHTRWVFKPHLAGWSTRKLGHIRRKDVLDLHQHIGAKSGRTMANRVLQLLRAMYGFAERAEVWSGQNPAAKIRLFHEEKRQRFLQPEELPRLFMALKEEPSRDLADFTLLALWTSARKADVFGMRWEDVRLDDNRWDIPNPKNREAYPVPLTPEAIQILRDRLSTRKDDNPFVFPGTGATGHVTDLKKRWQAMLKRANISGFHVHDLRRTRPSWEAGQGSSLLLIGKGLGHKSAAPTQIYARLNLDPVRASVMAATRAMLAAGEQKQLPEVSNG